VVAHQHDIDARTPHAHIDAPSSPRLLLGSAGIFLLAACGTDDATPSASPGGARGPLGISAIPDQDPEL